jgi:hypothetical protein
MKSSPVDDGQFICECLDEAEATTRRIRPMFKKLVMGLVTIGALLLWTGVSSAATNSSTSPRARQVSVPVSVLGGQGTAEGARPVIAVRVGNSPAVPVLVDTGSSGLHIFDNVVDTSPGSGVSLTSQKADITYSGGHRFVGVVADAVITMGSSATKMPVPFAYVERAFCIASKPTCPASGGIPGFEQSGMYGILGIGTQESDGGIISPILGMGGARGARWSLHLSGAAGTLTLGARLPHSRAATTVEMTRIGTSAGSALWADSRLPLCVHVGAVSNCVSGLFDSGTYTMQVSGPGLDRAPTIPGTDQVEGGTPVTISLEGATTPFWSFAAGTIKSKDLVTVKPDHGAFINSGVQAFYDFTVTYDDVTGQIRLSH